MTNNLTINAETQELQKVITELEEFAQIGHLSLELRKCLLGFLKSSTKLVRIQTHHDATRAGKLLVTLHPSDRLLGLLAACRAGNLDHFFVEETLTH